MLHSFMGNNKIQKAILLEGPEMRIAICDDEELFRKEFKTVLDKQLAELDYDIDTFPDGNLLFDSFCACPYDLVFLEDRKSVV